MAARKSGRTYTQLVEEIVELTTSRARPGTARNRCRKSV